MQIGETMKKIGYRTIGWLILLLVYGIRGSSAQSISTATWNVPFAFSIGKATLPAGEYFIQSTNPANERATLSIKNRKDPKSAYFLVSSRQKGNFTDNSTLVFHRYEDQYFLAEIWIQGENTGRVLPMTQAEREVASEHKHASLTQAKLVTVAARN